MHQVVPNVYQIEGLRTGNVFVIVEDSLTLIDTGMKGDAGKILAQLETADHTASDIQRIIITHAHGDHTGNLAALASRSGAQVMAHEAEVPYIEQTQRMPHPNFLQQLLSQIVDLMSKSAPCTVDMPLPEGTVVDVLGGLRVIHAPGHTPGNIVLYQPEQQLLFCGDVMFNGGPFGGREKITLPPTLFSTDPDQAAASARRLAELPLETVCFGHGAPIVGGAGEKIRAALA